MSETRATRAGSPFARPAFRRLTIGWVATNLGDSALYLVLAIWVRELTGSVSLGASVFVALGAASLLAPFAGQLADRVRRRPLLIVTQVVGALVVACLLLMRDAESVWIAFAVAFGYGLVGTVTGAAQAGLLRDMLPDEELGSANGAFSSIDNGMRIISPSLGTGLYVLAGPWAVIALSAVGFVVMAVVLLATPIEESEPEAEEGVPYLRQVAAGFHALLMDPLLRALAIAMAIAFAATGFINAAVFPFIETATGAGAAALGPLQTVQGVGALLGGLCSAWVMARVGERRLVTYGLWILAVSLALGLAAVLVVEPGVAGWIAVGVVQLLIGLSIPWIIVGTVTYRMRVTPARLQGRAAAALNLLANAPQMILMAVGAGMLALVDFRWYLVACLVGVVVGALYAALAKAEPASSALGTTSRSAG